MYVLLLVFNSLFASTLQICTNKIYCQGTLLHKVQSANLFNDSKTFVDMVQLNSPNVTMDRFDRLMANTRDNPSMEQLRHFVFNNFERIGELELYTPPDYKPEPKLVKEINNPTVKHFTKSLIAVWPTLGRTIHPDVFTHPDRYSIIPVKNGFIIPGGRFRELYYWDTYWIIKGLLLSDMAETARGMIENLLSMVERFGFVPNGGRIYNLNRSQPPVLSLMMAEYITYTQDYDFLRTHINTLESELLFWLEKRTRVVEIGGKNYTLAHFSSNNTKEDIDEDHENYYKNFSMPRESSSLKNRSKVVQRDYGAFGMPRPESYIEDIETCSIYKYHQERSKCYTEIQGGAESGWDFSSRWFFDDKGDPTNMLQTIQSRRILPVDLNAYLCRAFREMTKFFYTTGDTKKSQYWNAKMEHWIDSVQTVLYDNEHGIWFDFDIEMQKRRKVFYASNFAPLWTECYDVKKSKEYGKRAVLYLKNSGIVDYAGGIPTSLIKSGEQWDFPNAWPPLQEVVIMGLEKTGDPEAQEVARMFAKRWIESNIKAFIENKEMFEKYDSVHPGQYGGGGEYDVQSGFGWSNGAALSIIHSYYRDAIGKQKIKF